MRKALMRPGGDLRPAVDKNVALAVVESALRERGFVPAPREEGVTLSDGSTVQCEDAHGYPVVVRTYRDGERRTARRDVADLWQRLLDVWDRKSDWDAVQSLAAARVAGREP